MPGFMPSYSRVHVRLVEESELLEHHHIQYVLRRLMLLCFPCPGLLEAPPQYTAKTPNCLDFGLLSKAFNSN